MWDIGRVARFFHSVKRDTRPVRRDRRENSVAIFSLAGAIRFGEVNGVCYVRKRRAGRGNATAGEMRKTKASRPIFFMALPV